ncbi:sugar porter family MFS transporter [Nonomuraea sp. NPDC049695]|uniref:sugar porter family MFS transporter n=1 Tax=Nonomuraea sp. NPDC049695 TaxID=3154734 RepID=UPI0034310E63
MAVVSGRLVLCGVAMGVIYGYDSGAIAGALLFIPDDLGLSTPATQSLTAVTIAGYLVGALGAGRLAEAVGRKAAMTLSVVGYVAFALLAAAASGLVWLDVARFLLGVAIGVVLVTVPVFLGESASTGSRGSMVVVFQVSTVAGIMLGYLVDFLLAGSGAWRWMLGGAAGLGVLALVALRGVPDTPRWYVSKGRFAEAEAALRRTEPGADFAEAVAEMRASWQAERGGSARELWRLPYLRATAFVVALGFLVQITGISAIGYYGPFIFAGMGFTGHAALLLLPAAVQGVGLAAGLVALSLVDRLGRRPVLLAGVAGMVVADLVLVWALADQGRGAAGFAGVLLFTAAFNAGLGSVVWVYAAESFPARLRLAGASVMLTCNLVANFLVAQFFLSSLESLGASGTFGVLLGFAALAWVFLWRLAPETRERPLESVRAFWENGGRWPD